MKGNKMTLGLFIGVIAIISVLWFIKLSEVLKKASQADEEEDKKEEGK